MEEICSGCLSSKRSLHNLHNLQQIYKLILPEITENTQILRLCWECIGELSKCQRFRTKVLKARDILHGFKKDLLESNVKGVDALQPLSTLISTTKLRYDYDLTQGDLKCNLLDADKKLTIDIDVKVETNDEVEIEIPIRSNTNNDPLIPINDSSKHVEEIFIEPAGEFAGGFDDDFDSDTEVLSKVKVKMKKTKVPESDVTDDVTKTKIKKRERKCKTEKVKKRSTAKKDKKDIVKKASETTVPTNEQILEMFTSITFCKNLYDVDGNNVEVLLMTPEEMKQRRTILREDPVYAESSYKCKTCIKGYSDKEQLENHNMVHHVQRLNELQCPICESWVPQQLYNLHTGRHRILYRCIVCLYTHDDVACILAHLRHHTRHRGKNYCWMCKTNFRNPRGLRLHKEQVHGGNKEIFTCDKCGKTFNCSIYYRDHLKRHAYQPIPCKICNKLCKSASAHSFHMKAHATVMSGEKFKCVECDIDFAQPVLLKNHFQTRKHMHPSEFKHICDACGKGFLWASSLQEHVNYVHRKKTDYVCERCNKMFVSARCMRNHIKLVHEGLKPKKNKECNICGKRFAGKKTLTDHINTHTGVRPYKCEECGDTFKQSAALFTHRRLVHQGYRKARRNAEAAGFNINN